MTSAQTSRLATARALLAARTDLNRAIDTGTQAAAADALLSCGHALDTARTSRSQREAERLAHKAQRLIDTSSRFSD